MFIAFIFFEIESNPLKQSDFWYPIFCLICRDASWELEENAYQDLLHCYQHCDVKRCLCKKGRDYNEPDRYDTSAEKYNLG